MALRISTRPARTFGVPEPAVTRKRKRVRPSQAQPKRAQPRNASGPSSFAAGAAGASGFLPTAADPAGLRHVWMPGAPPPTIKAILEAVGSLSTPWGSTIADEYKKDAGVWEKYTLLRHHTMVLGQFRKYFSGRLLPGMTHAQLELTLALHDAGKAEAVRHGSKELQHVYTRQLVEHLATQLPVEPKMLARMIALIDGDPLGLLLVGRKSLAEAAAETRKMAADAGMPVADFLELLIVYYQSDSSAYTRDAGGVPSLDHVFVEKNGRLQLDRALGRLRFSQTDEANTRKLYAELGVAVP